MKQRIRLTESDLRRVINESVRSVLKEYIGNSSANGYEYGQRNQGGAYGGSPLDQYYDSVNAQNQKRARNANLNALLDKKIDEFMSYGYDWQTALKYAKEALRNGGWDC